MKRKKKKTKDEEYKKHLEKKVRNLETENRLLEAERLSLEQELQRLRNEFDRDAERIKFFGDRKRAFKEERKKKKTFQKSSGDREGAFKLCIFGDDGVGKTTLIHRYATKVFDEDIKMTVGADFYVKDLEIDGKKIIIRIWVFGGEQRFKVLLPSFAKGADGGIFMYDITRYTSVKNIDDWLSIFEKNVREKEIHIPIIMVGNKVDDKQHRVVSQVDAVEIQEKYNLASYIEISAITGENVKKMFDVIINLMLKRTEGGDYIRSRTERLGNFDEEIAYMSDKEITEVVKERLRERKRLAREFEEKSKRYKKNIHTEMDHYDILLIEDDLSTIRLVTTYFETRGVTCKGVVSFTKGLEELANHPPKVVLTHIIGPDMSGYDACKIIKSDPDLKHIPVFLFTAVPWSEVKNWMKDTQADGYIPKPFDFSDFDRILTLCGVNPQKLRLNQQEDEPTKNSLTPRLTDEEIEHLDLESIKVQELMEQYKEETGKFAIWRGTVTEGFIKWLKGEKVYTRAKERISLYEPIVKLVDCKKCGKFLTLKSLYILLEKERVYCPNCGRIIHRKFNRREKLTYLKRVKRLKEASEKAKKL